MAFGEGIERAANHGLMAAYILSASIASIFIGERAVEQLAQGNVGEGILSVAVTLGEAALGVVGMMATYDLQQHP